eukprot:5375593-Pyramimonas_sp.AAC.1
MPSICIGVETKILDSEPAHDGECIERMYDNASSSPNKVAREQWAHLGEVGVPGSGLKGGWAATWLRHRLASGDQNSRQLVTVRLQMPPYLFLGWEQRDGPFI